MISETQIKWFFENMKKRSVLPEKSEIFNWKIEENIILIRYSVNEKNFSYKISKESILTFLREWKLNQII